MVMPVTAELFVMSCVWLRLVIKVHCGKQNR